MSAHAAQKATRNNRPELAFSPCRRPRAQAFCCRLDADDRTGCARLTVPLDPQPPTNAELQLICEKHGLAVIGPEAEVELFLHSQGWQSRDMALRSSPRKVGVPSIEAAVVEEVRAQPASTSVNRPVAASTHGSAVARSSGLTATCRRPIEPAGDDGGMIAPARSTVWWRRTY